MPGVGHGDAPYARLPRADELGSPVATLVNSSSPGKPVTSPHALPTLAFCGRSCRCGSLSAGTSSNVSKEPEGGFYLRVADACPERSQDAHRPLPCHDRTRAAGPVRTCLAVRHKRRLSFQLHRLWLEALDKTVRGSSACGGDRPPPDTGRPESLPAYRRRG
jgi:hypothetical protein